MKLLRRRMVVAFLLILPASASVSAQTLKSDDRGLHPYATVVIGPGTARGSKQGEAHPVLDFAVGARKRVAAKVGLVISANAGKTFEQVLGGSDASCRVVIANGVSSKCLPHAPLLDWFGLSAGGEGYFGRTIVGLQFGPASVGTKAYERDPTTGARAGRVIGFSSRVDVHFPLVNRLGISLSATNRRVPKIAGARMTANSLGAGLTLR